jgi:hypothetical protein
MDRQKSRRQTNTVRVEERPDGTWAVQDVAPGWRTELRVVLASGTPIVAELRIVPADPGRVPDGGIGSEVLRRLTVSRARDAAAERLLADTQLLRAYERIGPRTRQRGEARRWSLAITAWAYALVVRQGSQRPNEDVARGLALPVDTVRDRVHAARHGEPRLLTGGGRRGAIGEAQLTPAAIKVIEDRMQRVKALLGVPRGEPMRYTGTIPQLDELFARLLAIAEKRMPGLWEMELDEISAHSHEFTQAEYEGLLEGRRDLLSGFDGLRLIDRGEPTP